MRGFCDSGAGSQTSLTLVRWFSSSYSSFAFAKRAQCDSQHRAKLGHPALQKTEGSDAGFSWWETTEGALYSASQKPHRESQRSLYGSQTSRATKTFQAQKGPTSKNDCGAVRRYWMVLATEEKALLAFEPTRRIVPTTNTNITASITAYSAMSCPQSSDQSWGRILICLQFLSIAKIRTLGWNANATEDRARLDEASEL